jgi:mono/diheme cytochrome c family protein
VTIGLVAALGMVAAGCRQDMHQAARYDPLERSDFYADQRSSRPLVEGTVARGFLRDDARFYAGKDGATLVSDIPTPVTKELLVRGQDRFDVYCSPCHGRTGEGNGMIVQRGLKQPPSFHTERLRAQVDGYYYDVMTNGFGAMQDYSAQVAPQDRWAIVAYVRALQYSRRVNVADLPEAERAKIQSGEAGAAPVPSSHGGSATHE